MNLYSRLFVFTLRRLSQPLPSYMSQRISGSPLSSFTLSLPTLTERSLTPSPLPSPRRLSASSESHPGNPDVAKCALQDAVSKRGTKASNTNIDNDVKKMCKEYSLLEINDKEDFLIHVAKTLSTNHQHVADLIRQMPRFEAKTEATSSCSDAEALIRWEDKLRQSLQAPYHWLATQISRMPGGVKFLIDWREDVLTLLSNQAVDRQIQMELKAFDAHLRDLLSLWFTVGLLELQRITWDSPCDMLQKISEYEAVHPMRNWTDLKKRVGNYRRCFVFTHSCMPAEPLVVLHTFLTSEISKSMIKIVQNQRNLSIDETGMRGGEDPSLITTAIFYSITSTQKGLKGIELGNYLIKRVVKELQAEIPHLSQFSSLSPIPGFSKWLQNNILRAQRGELTLFSPAEMEQLQKELESSTPSEAYADLRGLFKANGWAREDDLRAILEEPLMRLCSYYLYLEKRRGYAFDPVANFHLRNGAVMWRINWKADSSPRGMDNSCGIMVNYRYFLDSCEENSKNYLESSRISASENIIYLAKMAENMSFKNTIV